MARSLTGLKIRARRKHAGLTQHELARRAGISASYLNLIERNRRPAAAALLQRISAGLGIDPGELDGEAERRLAAGLEEIAVDPALAAGARPPDHAEDLVGNHPAWAELIVRLHGAWHDQSQAVIALADRLNRDPFLGESVHRMLSDVTSISSAAEILTEADTLAPADRQRFLSIIASDGARLSTTARALLAFFDSSQFRVRSATAMENVDTFIFTNDNYFPALEDLAGELPLPQDGAPRSGEDMLPAATESRRFAQLRSLARDRAHKAVEAIVAAGPSLADTESRELAAAALYGYVAAARLMPYERFLAAAERHRYDIDVLARLFSVSYEQTAHRLATLRRPGMEGVRFAFMRSDPSGYVTKRLPLPGLPLPRYGTACPLWPVYGAFQSPGVTVRNFGELPTGDRHFFFARAVDKGPARVGEPRRLLSVMLACAADEAGRLAAADGIDAAGAMLPVGTICRLCRRAGCAHRQEAPLIAETPAAEKRPMSGSIADVY